LTKETSPDEAATIWTATKVLMGLRYSKDAVEEFTKGISAMILGIRGIEESSVYQDIFAKGEAEGQAKGRAEGQAKGRAEGQAEGEARGRVEEALEAVLRVGSRKFGPPADQLRAKISTIAEVEQLNSLLERILEVSSWDELLSPPGAGGMTAPQTPSNGVDG
jgi:predicted transposase YdaD